MRSDTMTQNVLALLLMVAASLTASLAYADYTHEPEYVGSYTAPILGGTATGFSPQEVCAQARDAEGPGRIIKLLQQTGATTWSCIVGIDGGYGVSTTITGPAPSCHPGDTYSTSTQLCTHPGDPPSCSLPAGTARYELVTDAPVLNYSPQESYCQEQCRFDYVDSYFFDNGAIENRYETQGGLCGSNEFPDPPGGDLSGDPTQPDPEENCYNVIGWVNGELVCGDKADQCEAMGGAYGFVNGQEVCIDQEEDPPECPPRTVLTASVGGGHECVAVDPEPPPEEPPCETEGDEDCDGTPDETDPDKDGDGRPDGDHPYEGDGTCDPTHPGYSICIGDTENIGDNVDNALDAKVRGNAAAEGDRILNAGKEALGDGISGIGEGAGDAIGNSIVEALGLGGGSCTDAIFNINGQVWTFSCDTTEPIRILLAYAFSILTIMSVFRIATAPHKYDA